MTTSPRTTIGWREWVDLPTLGLVGIKAKVDTGARTSALHAINLELAQVDGMMVARFDVLPRQRHDDDPTSVTTTVIDQREVRSSSGALDLRPVISTEIRLLDTVVVAEVTLTNREEMGFRLLVGRQAIRRRFVVDPARSYLGGSPADD